LSLDPQMPSQYTHTTKGEVSSDTLQREVLIRSAGNFLYYLDKNHVETFRMMPWIRTIGQKNM
jgi:hypothetical protein